jgi:hypothetical protein
MSLSKSEQARINGAKSRGSISIEGKQRASMNAPKHGLRADKVVVLQSEMPELFDRLFAAFVEKFNPQDDAERELVLQAVNARWRLRRVWQLETTLFDLEMDEQRDAMKEKFSRFDEGTRQAVAFKSLGDGGSIMLLSRYESRLTREYEKAIRALDRARAERPSPGPSDLPNEPKPDQPTPVAEHKSWRGLQPAASRLIAMHGLTHHDGNPIPAAPGRIIPFRLAVSKMPVTRAA